jgi:uncharacterized protein
MTVLAEPIPATLTRPRHKALHLVSEGALHQLLLADGSLLFEIDDATADAVAAALEAGGEGVEALLARHGLDQPAPIRDGDAPVEPPIRALSLAVAQKCNLGCSYCYAKGGDFGGPARNMPADVARASVDLLLAEAKPGDRLNLAFLGGEPLANRAVLHETTGYAARLARGRGLSLGFSITTNGTLVGAADIDLFEAHGFAVTVSLDGPRDTHDRLRPYKGGAGSFDRILANIGPALARQGRMQVSARITVTPRNLDLPETLDAFVALGFHSVGFSPMLSAPADSADEMDDAALAAMLDRMIACGRRFEDVAAAGRRYPFANLLNALKELHKGTHRPYACGAGAGYLAVSAEGELAACHRFVGDDAGAMGSLAAGLDRAAQVAWLAERHVHRQSPCSQCWARYLCGGGCHHEVIHRGRPACDYIRGWLHYCIGAYGRLRRTAPALFAAAP